VLEGGKQVSRGECKQSDKVSRWREWWVRARRTEFESFNRIDGAGGRKTSEQGGNVNRATEQAGEGTVGESEESNTGTYSVKCICVSK
jgi:hypothetical protein